MQLFKIWEIYKKPKGFDEHKSVLILTKKNRSLHNFEGIGSPSVKLDQAFNFSVFYFFFSFHLSNSN